VLQFFLEASADRCMINCICFADISFVQRRCSCWGVECTSSHLDKSRRVSRRDLDPGWGFEGGGARPLAYSLESTKPSSTVKRDPSSVISSMVFFTKAGLADFARASAMRVIA